MTGGLGQWAGRLTGFSTPLFGASWQPIAAERDVARELLTRLEDRRVLYSPSFAEVPNHCIQSVIEVRHILTDALTRLSNKGVLADHIRAMGAASRRFLERIGSEATPDYDAMRQHGHYLSWEFLDALGQLRGIFGVHIAIVAARFNLDVHGELASVLPAEPAASDLAS